MNVEIALVFIVILIMLFILVKEWASPDLVVFFALVTLLLLGVIPPQEAFKGFSNEGVITITFLFIIAAAIQQNVNMQQFLKNILGNSNHPRRLLVRLMLPVSAISAFMNNTPIVVMLMSELRRWCSHRKIAPSKVLIPLSYASIFGGMITLIGTSTNLVIHGMMLDAGIQGFSMFTLAVVGIPAAILGIIYVVIVGYKLLPTHKTPEEVFKASSREYLCEALVEQNAPLLGLSIEQAGLRNLEGLFLIEIIRNEERIIPVSSNERLEAGDRLIFTGVVSTIVELQKVKGLRLETGSGLGLKDLKNGEANLVEAVVSHHSSLIHRSIKDQQFRSKYDAAVVAVHRNQERVSGKIGEIITKPGDVLLLLTGKDFKKRVGQSKDFYLVSPLDKPVIGNPEKQKLTLLILTCMLLLVVTGVLSMLKAAALAVFTLFVTRCITYEEAKHYIHFRVLLLIASSIGMGIALEQSGGAQFIADRLVKLTEQMHVIILLMVIYLIANVVTEVVTNVASAALMFPIAVSSAEQLSLDPMALIIPVTIAASASFATPIGYQTNLLVYGPGGYKFKDYLKVGIPLNLLYMLVTLIIVYILYIV